MSHCVTVRGRTSSRRVGGVRDARQTSFETPPRTRDVPEVVVGARTGDLRSSEEDEPCWLILRLVTAYRPTPTLHYHSQGGRGRLTPRQDLHNDTRGPTSVILRSTLCV